ncbi:MAG: hypothetical protein HY559_06360 [Gammaproteobacteria bacterium]|nr:hypothetical protein [Gammaproteobacteria bacterium]
MRTQVRETQQVEILNLEFWIPNFRIGCLSVLFLLAGCATFSPPTPPPRSSHDICGLFLEEPNWYKGAREAYLKWGIPIYIQAAIIYQESAFRPHIRPPRIRMLGLIPLMRPSSAYGYAQVLDGTWRWYQEKTNRLSASRHKFEDVADFIGWYNAITVQKNGVSKEDAYHQYLAYHEGHRGFQEKTYSEKAWLMQAAQNVHQRALVYQKQLDQCGAQLEKKCCSQEGLIAKRQEN